MLWPYSPISPLILYSILYFQFWNQILVFHQIHVIYYRFKMTESMFHSWKHPNMEIISGADATVEPIMSQLSVIIPQLAKLQDKRLLSNRTVELQWSSNLSDSNLSYFWRKFLDCQRESLTYRTPTYRTIFKMYLTISCFFFV